MSWILRNYVNFKKARKGNLHIYIFFWHKQKTFV